MSGYDRIADRETPNVLAWGIGLSAILWLVPISLVVAIVLIL